MESNVGTLKSTFEAFDPHGDCSLDRQSLLKMLKDIDPDQPLWTEENINLILDFAAPGCKGHMGYQQLLTWVFPASSIFLDVMLSTGEQLSGIAVEPHWRGSEIKARVRQLLKAGQQLAKLLFRGQAVVDDATVAQLGVKSGSTLLALLSSKQSSDSVAKAKDFSEQAIDSFRESAPSSPATLREESAPASPPMSPPLSPVSPGGMGRRKSLSDRRKLTLTNPIQLNLPEDEPKTQSVAKVKAVQISDTVEEPALALAESGSMKERFLLQLEKSSSTRAPIEPMTDTRHNVKAWGNNNDQPLSLWARRKAEIKKIEVERDSGMQVEAMKMEKLFDVPESPKRPGKSQKFAFSLFDAIPENDIVETSSATVASPSRKRNKPKPDRARFCSSSD